MKLGVVSDTHGHTGFALDAVRMLESLEVDLVIHCGDIGSLEIPRLFADWPAHFVRGNVDRNEVELERAVQRAGLDYHGHFGTLEMAGKKIAFLHGDDERRLHSEVQSGNWDLICCGHTHVADCTRQGDTLVLNPGALYRATPHSLAVVEMPQLEATIVQL